ncbi:MAG: GNAT family N-acetyltransferase [Polyangia bacterium]|jgi:RimJ/RimL family protein N-acetyltransferase
MIETERLLLRPLSLDDVDAMAPMYADAEVMTFLGGVKTRHEAAERIKLIMSLFAEQGFGLFGVVEKSSGSLLGRAGLIVQQVEGAREVELAYGLKRQAWGQGYATEAVAAAREWGFRRLPEPRFVSLVHAANLRSVRVAERLGARHNREVDYQGQRVRLYVHERP